MSPAGTLAWYLTAAGVAFQRRGWVDRTRLLDVEGRSHRVPFRRVREVYEDAQRIWHRPQAAK